MDSLSTPLPNGTLFGSCQIPLRVIAPGTLQCKVSDAQQFAYTWLEAFQCDLNIMASCVRINCLLESVRVVQDPSPWPNHLTYFFAQHYSQWMAILPSTRTTPTVTSSTSGPTNGGVGTLPLTRGHLSGHHTTTTPTTSVVSDSVTTVMTNVFQKK